jgi:cytochrome c oxidase subunit 2
MLGELVVMPAEEFDEWLARSRRGLASAQDGAAVPGEVVLAGSNLVEEGRRVAAEQGCLKCHTLDGSRHIGPTWVDLFGRTQRMKDGRMVVADEGYLTRSMMDPAAEVVAGYQNVMPTFQGKLSPPEAAAVVEFIKSLKTPAVRVGPSEGPVYESVDKKRP